MDVVFGKQQFDVACKTTIEQLKKYSKNLNTVISTSFWLNERKILTTKSRKIRARETKLAT